MQARTDLWIEQPSGHCFVSGTHENRMANGPDAVVTAFDIDVFFSERKSGIVRRQPSKSSNSQTKGGRNAQPGLMWRTKGYASGPATGQPCLSAASRSRVEISNASLNIMDRADIPLAFSSSDAPPAITPWRAAKSS